MSLFRKKATPLQESDPCLNTTIIENLPLPLIVVNADQKVILVNREARALSRDREPIEPGRQVFDYFPDQVTGRLSLAIRTRKTFTIQRCPVWGKLYNIECISLTLSSERSGGFLVLTPVT